MINRKEGNVQFMEFSIYETHPIKAVFSTRNGGVSEGFYSTMNLSFSRGDDSAKVLRNYDIFSKAIGLELSDFVSSTQTHTANILEVDYSDRGIGIIRPQPYKDIDGLYTEDDRVVLVTHHADCTPVYFYDPKRGAVGLAHAGWRGTALKIVEEMIKLFKSKGSKPEDMLCAIGPSICSKCYEVGQEVIDSMDFDFDVYDFVDTSRAKPHIDIKMINREILIRWGVKPENIEVAEECTMCMYETFFSHRKCGNNRGGQIAILRL